MYANSVPFFIKCCVIDRNKILEQISNWVAIIFFKVFQDEKYLNIALECGDVVWKRGLLCKGYSICHGVSGNAYTFLELFQRTKVWFFLLLIFSQNEDKHSNRTTKSVLNSCYSITNLLEIFIILVDNFLENIQLHNENIQKLLSLLSEYGRII